jgi:hypothetical protein
MADTVLISGEQLLKAINKLPDLSKADIDSEAVLLRAYGKGTDVLIDRESESHDFATNAIPLLTDRVHRGNELAFPSSTPRSRTFATRPVRKRSSVQVYSGHGVHACGPSQARSMAWRGTEARRMACNITYIEYQQHVSYSNPNYTFKQACICGGHGGIDAGQAHPKCVDNYAEVDSRPAH